MKDISACLSELPEIVKLKILDYYIIAKGDSKHIIWPNQICRLKDFGLFCSIYSKVQDSGFIRIDKPDLKLITNKFHNVSLNQLIDKSYMKKLIEDCWNRNGLQYHANLRIFLGRPFRQNVHLAGGFFTEYQFNLFAQEFKHYYDYFISNRDIDMFYMNENASPKRYKKYCFKLDDYESYFNLIVSKENPLKVISEFDFDCCKFFYSFDDDEIYAHNSLVFKRSLVEMPSFFEIEFDEEGIEFRVRNNACVCDRFKRVLKYMMKGFCIPHRENIEIERAHQIEKIISDYELSGDNCTICGKPLFPEFNLLDLSTF